MQPVLIKDLLASTNKKERPNTSGKIFVIHHFLTKIIK